MLREIEGWSDYLLAVLNELPKTLVDEQQGKREKERRKEQRRTKKEEQKRAVRLCFNRVLLPQSTELRRSMLYSQYDERLAKSAARAMAEVVKSVSQLLASTKSLTCSLV